MAVYFILTVSQVFKDRDIVTNIIKFSVNIIGILLKYILADIDGKLDRIYFSI